ncbi:FecR family protein [Ottowia sp. VDI28]|uniref:FecR family protein n=1 Tax=Ottowia sp. VDI28 TaxID=3133968 RepID=UPI003C307572
MPSCFRIRSGYRTFLLLLVTILACAGASAQEPPSSITPSDDRQGTFKAVQGEVTLIRADVRRAAVVGGGFSRADRLVTGADSAASLKLEDGTILSVGPDSTLELEDFAFDATTQEGNMAVKLLRGTLRVVTGLIAKLTPEKVSVRTPTAVIGVRGTDFIVDAKEAK